MSSVLGAIVLVGCVVGSVFVTMAMCGWLDWRERVLLRESYEKSCEAFESVAHDNRNRLALVEGQRNRLARLLRKYDRCECGMERREHGPEGFALAYGRCSGFRLKTPADSLETVVETDPPMGLSELYDPSPGEESSQKIAPKLAEKMAARQQMFLMQRGIVPVEQLEKALVENSYEPATIITSPVLTPEQITKLERADKLEVIDLRENRDEPPADCEVVPVPNPKSEEYSWYSPPIRRTAEDLNEPMCVSDEGLR